MGVWGFGGLVVVGLFCVWQCCTFEGSHLPLKKATCLWFLNALLMLASGLFVSKKKKEEEKLI